MAISRRGPRTGIEDRWFPTVVIVDPVTGKTTKQKVKSEERHGKGKRWRARYVDPNGIERSRLFHIKADAQRFLDGDVTTKVVTGTWVDPDRSGVLFSVVAEKWFSTKQLRKPKTVAGYRSLLDTLVIPRWGPVPLDEIELAWRVCAGRFGRFMSLVVADHGHPAVPDADGNVADASCPPLELPVTMLVTKSLPRATADASGRYVYGEFRVVPLEVDNIATEAGHEFATEIVLRTSLW